MTPEAAEELLHSLGSKKTSETSAWIRGPCPLAVWNHPSKKDSNPSFGILIDPGKEPKFHCFTCDTGSLSTLLQTIEFRNQQQPGLFKGDLSKAREIITAAESEMVTLPPYSEFGNQASKEFSPLPMDVLMPYPPSYTVQRSKEYCAHRGIFKEEQEQFNLRYDIARDMLMYPYTSVWGKLAGVRGRRIVFPGEDPGTISQHHDYVFNNINNSSLVFYNEQCLQLPGKVIVVEGQLDALYVARYWPKVVANLTAKPVMTRTTKLCQTEGVILMMDGDLPGRQATDKWVHMLDYLKVPVQTVLLPWDEVSNVKTDPASIGHEFLVTVTSKLKEMEK